jgi:hypothetical protein
MTEGCYDIPAPANTAPYNPDEIILYGIKLGGKRAPASLRVGKLDTLEMKFFKGAKSQTSDYSIVAGYGYSFEGHCYRFDNVRIFVVKHVEGNTAIGCGFDLPNTGRGPSPWMMWRLRAASKLLEVTPSYNDAQTLILDAAMPGKRAPNTYGVKLALAHRGGRMSME